MDNSHSRFLTSLLIWVVGIANIYYAYKIMNSFDDGFIDWLVFVSIPIIICSITTTWQMYSEGDGGWIVSLLLVMSGFCIMYVFYTYYSYYAPIIIPCIVYFIVCIVSILLRFIVYSEEYFSNECERKKMFEDKLQSAINSIQNCTGYVVEITPYSDGYHVNGLPSDEDVINCLQKSYSVHFELIFMETVTRRFGTPVLI